MSLIAFAFCPALDAAPDAGITNGGVVYFEGNQSQGAGLQVSTTGPAMMVVSNLNQSIAPSSGTPGVQIGGTDSSRNLTVTVDGGADISTYGDGGYGIFAENGGGFAGSYELVTNSFTIMTNVINGTNVITITTNIISGSDNNYTNLVPAGGAMVINHGQVTTTGSNAHGIFAESLPGTITLTLSGSPVVNQSYGDGGPVTVFNSGNLTTYGTNSHGIFAQSLGGYGPENSYSAGSGSDVSVQTAGGNITTYGDSSIGIFAQSRGGDNQGGESGGVGGDGRTGGLGGDAGQVSVTGFGGITTYSNNSQGIFALSQAGNGGNGGNGGSLGGSGGNGGSGGKGSNVVVNGIWDIETYGTNSGGIIAQSLGGRGGSGGNGSHFIDLGGGNGGGTGDGGTVSVTSAGNIHTRGSDSLGIYARSLGGFAGNGGDSYNPFYGDAGDGNSAGAGSDVSVMNSGNITTEGDLSQAIYAESVGGGGGSAGSSGALVSLGSSGGAGGNAGNVVVTNYGTLLTYGSGSLGIEAQSLGGGGGDGGSAGGLVALGGQGSIASTGEVVTVYNIGTITTYGSNSYAILAQSIGGGGGNAGSASGAASLGASGGGGGDGGAVHVFNSGQFQDTGADSYGLFAQSIGGGGGNGSGAGGIFAYGGSGGTASQGDVVKVFNSGSIFSSESAIFAQSIGGGGGNGGDGGGWFSIGGSGGDGNNSSAVTVNNSGDLQTTEANASALLAQSIGGGGGNGGNSVAVGVFGSLAIGGYGGEGGNGSYVNVTSGTNNILTAGNNSYGIDAESIGGGGGNGGYAVSAAVGTEFSAAIALGGNGSGGGSASNVTVVSDSAITTYGTNSHGIFAQSIGGGGGGGGFSVAVSGSETASLSLSMGGTGGGGGNGGIVNVTNTGAILTTSQHSYGILAQSVGGGGGDGGFAIAASFASGGGVAASLAFGGSGATGGVSSAVSLINSGDIMTVGDDSHALMAQSVGGGGGSGGFSIAGSAGGGALGASFGGSGAGAGSADMVSLFNDGDLTTYGDRSDGIVAQSVGGGGGDGGFSVAGDVGKNASLGLSFGGDGGTGGNAGSVVVTNSGVIATYGDNSHGIFAQSLGGGGGAGGFGLAGGLGQGEQSINAALAMGGDGTTGGVASVVSVLNSGMIETSGTNADGILAQSVGGGGGAGGFSAAGTLALGTNSAQVSVSVGGTGGEGNLAGAVTVDNTAQIVTHGNDSRGIFAQSVGGGGGDGGMSIAGAFSQGTSSTTSLAIGGDGGIGGDGSSVSVNDSGNIFTDGDRAHGILAQSVGGGGGNGGLAVAFDLSLGSTGMVTQFAISIGGTGGAGGIGGNVFVGGSNSVVTTGQDAYGVFAQSVGGGGGSGGLSLAATAILGANQGTNRALTVAVGGSGGDGNNGGSVALNRSGSIETYGDGSYGIIAQSIGGGGGDAGGARSFSLFTKGGGGGGDDGKSESKSESINISVGGKGGGASSGGDVIITNVGDITTHGADAYGIFAQSVGGGGGSGGNAHSSTDELLPISVPGLDDVIEKAITTESEQYQIVVGGSAGSSGAGSQVIVNQTGDITTLSDGSYGIFAQSIGGGGGVGGNGDLGLEDGLIGIGGGGGASGNGGAVDVTYNGNIITVGAGSAGIFAQSVGGGGGAAGDVDRGLKDAGINVGQGFAFGQDGGSAGDGSNVTVTSVGNISTYGNGAYGIFAQSVGGGGGLVGDLGNNIPVLSTLTDFAGSVGGSGSGGDVTLSQTGDIYTYGTNSTGIFAQSAGGTNGVGGTIHISLNGSVYANGVDSDGIFAQSGGGATVVTAPIPTGLQAVSFNASPDAAPPVNGDVTVVISSNSVVQGGSGNSAGVRFLDGVNNTVENYGGITTLNGLSGTAISGTGGNDIVNNYGTIIGSVDLGAGGNAFNNKSGAIFDGGPDINVGVGNTLANDGTLMFGDATNVLTSALTGNFYQSTNGTLQIKLGSASLYDTLQVSGSATLDGTLSVFRNDNYLPTKGTEFTFLTASNLNGEFETLNDPYKGNYALKLHPVYSATNITFQVVQDSFLQFAHTPNEAAVSSYLNTISGLGGPGGDPRAAMLMKFLDTQNAGQIPTDLDLLSPASLGSMFDLDFDSVNVAMGNIEQRMADIRAGDFDASGSISVFNPRGQTIQLASAGSELPPLHRPTPDDGWGIFAAGNGQYVDINGSLNAPGYHFHSAGATVGLDKMISEKLAAGFTLGYAGADASLVNNGSVNAEGGRAGVYSTWFDNNYYVQGQIGGGYDHYNTQRAAIDGFASGNTGGYEFDSELGGGYDFKYGHAMFGPVANINFASVQVNAFTETGSLSPLSLENNDSQSMLTELGAHVGYDWKWDKTLIHPDLQAGWQHEYLDDNRTIDSQLASGAGGIFSVNSPTVGRNALSLDAAITVQWTRRISNYISYHGGLAQANAIAQSISGGLTIRF